MASTSMFPKDPRAPSLDERRAYRRQLQLQQQHWLERLRPLSEPTLADDFPAFLLATPAFSELAERLGPATRRFGLPTETLDLLDHFIEAFADYLRTEDGEDEFSSRRAS